MPKAKDKMPLSRPDPKPPTPTPPPPEAAPISHAAPPEAPKAEGQTGTEGPIGTAGIQELTGADTTVGIDQFMHSMFNEPVSEPAVQEPPKDQNAPEGTPEAKKAASTETPPALEPEKKAKKADATQKGEEDEGEEEDEKPEIDLDAIGRTVREAVSSITKPTEPAKPADAKPEQPQLSPSRRDTLETAQFMEQTMDEYRGSGLQGQLQRYWQSEDAHKAEWLKANPGKRYRSDDEEHNDFYTSNPLPDYSPDDFSDAQTLRRQKLDEDRESRHQQELSRLKFEAEAKQHEEEIRKTGSMAAADLYVNAPENVKAALTVDGKLVVNKETLEKLEMDEPVLAERLKYHGEVVSTWVEELERLTRFPEHVRTDPNNPVHQHLLNFADNLERYLLTRPKAETMRDGKAFIAQADYMARAETIRSSNASIPQKKAQLQALSDRHYFTDKEVIRENLIRSASHRARQEAEEIEARLAKSTKYANRSTPAPATAAATNGAQGSHAKAGDGRDVRPPSPTISSVDKTNAGGADPKNISDRDAAIDRAMWA